MSDLDDLARAARETYPVLARRAGQMPTLHVRVSHEARPQTSGATLFAAIFFGVLLAGALIWGGNELYAEHQRRVAVEQIRAGIQAAREAIEKVRADAAAADANSLIWVPEQVTRDRYIIPGHWKKKGQPDVVRVNGQLYDMDTR